MKRVMIVGTGLDAMRSVRKMRTSQIMQPIVFIGGADQKEFAFDGIPCVGMIDDIPSCIATYQIDSVYLAMPELGAGQRRQIELWCLEHNCSIYRQPDHYEIECRKLEIMKTLQKNLGELLGRIPVILPPEMKQMAAGKTILVTGAGGTIGAQICRELAKCEPKCLIMMDIAENDALQVSQEVETVLPALKLVIGSVTNERLLEQVFREYRPEIVFHAAAHKHVPLMETNLSECIENNVFGTYCCAQAARMWKTETFVLISTDKAVEPVSVMGRAKRLCEMIMQQMNEQSETNYISVRFGNVIGSSGSVLQQFARQIAMGGPLIITDPEMERFFMTVKEAARLVISAAFLPEKEHMYMLDMGLPIKIIDLANNLLRLLHAEETEVVFTGKRNGEKLNESLCAADEQLQPSGYPQILIVKTKDYFLGKEWLSRLSALRMSLFKEEEKIESQVQELIE